MLDPSLGATLRDLGGFALFLLHVVVVDGYGLLRQWWVPGYIYRDVLTERDELRKTVARLTTELARERRRRRDDPGGPGHA